jgi:hypothetical protein
MPVPDPDPPQPIPPPDPVPVPEPPHAAEDPQLVAQQADPATAPILEAGEPTITFPPIGAYPGEPGHPDQPGEGRPDQPGTSRPDQPGNQPGQPVPPGQPDERTQQWQHPLYPGQQWQAGEHGPWHPAPPPGSGQPWPLAEHPPYEVPLTPGTPAARPRRTALWVSLALAFTLLLCGGGAVSAFLLLRNADNGDGAPDPGTAVTRFLTAVYTEQNASEANAMVCREARDIKKITAKVDEVKGYARQYDAPRFRWEDPAVTGQAEKSATVAVALTMTTDDEKTAQQQLTFTVVKKTGWWVCEVAG